MTIQDKIKIAMEVKVPARSPDTKDFIESMLEGACKLLILEEDDLRPYDGTIRAIDSHIWDLLSELEDES